MLPLLYEMSKKQKRIVSVLSLLTVILSLGRGAYSFFTDYRSREFTAQSGVSLELVGDAGITSVSQNGYVAQKGTIGWYRKGMAAEVSARVQAGSHFLGWYAGETRVSSLAQDTLTIRESMMLEARSEKNVFFVRYEGNGANSGVMDMVTQVTYGNPTKLAKCAFGKTGYQWTGWAFTRQSDGKTKYWNPEDHNQTGWYAEGTQPKGWSYLLYTDEGSVYAASSADGDVITAKAQWQPNKLTVKYHGNHADSATLRGETLPNPGGELGVSSTYYYDQVYQDGLADPTNPQFLNLSRIGWHVDYSWYNGSHHVSSKGSHTGKSLAEAFGVDIGKGDAEIVAYADWVGDFAERYVEHWLFGFQQKEGYNQAQNAVRLAADQPIGAQQVGTNFSLTKKNLLEIPNGCKADDQVCYFEKYKEQGWYQSKTLEEPTEMRVNRDRDGNHIMSLELKYRPVSYSIAYELNEGVNNKVTVGELPKSYTAFYGVEFPVPAKPYADFLGWYDGNMKVEGINKGKKADFATSYQKIYDELAKRTVGNKTITAKWKPWIYTISYDANGGSGSMADTVCEIHELNQLRANAFTKTGYTFDCWTAQINDGSGRFRYKEPAASSPKHVWARPGEEPEGWVLSTYGDRGSTSNLSETNGTRIKFVAQWKPNTNTKYIVRHHQNEVLDAASYVLFETENLTGTTDSTLTLADLAKTYHGFDYVESKVGGVKATTTTVLADGTRVIDLYYNRIMLLLDMNENLDGVGIWSGHFVYKCDIWVNGVQTTDQSQDHTALYPYGSTYEIKNLNIQAGYTYLRCNHALTGILTPDYVSEGIPKMSFNVVIESNSYTIAFYANGGSGSMASMAMRYGTAANITANTFSRAGYTFAGWNTKADGTGTSYTDGQSVGNLVTTDGGTVTLYAQWKVLADPILKYGGYFAIYIPNDATEVIFTDEVAPAGTMLEDVSAQEDSSVVAWQEGTIFKVSSQRRGVNVIFNENCREMFNNKTNLTRISFGCVNTSRVTNMADMFYGCSSLSSLDLSNFDTRNVTNMESMFLNCKSLSSLDLSFLNMTKVTTMRSMFYGCIALRSVDLTGVDTRNVTDMYSMFCGCYNLSSLSLFGFDTESVTNISSMFSYCYNLSSLDLSSFNTGKATSMSFMFRGCSSLRGLDLSGLRTGNVTNMESMFDGCSSLSSLELSSFDTRNVTNMSHLFYGNRNLSNLNLSSFNTGKVTDMNNMFSECSSLSSLDLSYFDTRNVTNMDYMFSGCDKLQSVSLGVAFAWKGTNGYLPEPNSYYISGANGKWYNSKGVGFAPNKIPSNVADTYVAVKPATASYDMSSKEQVTESREMAESMEEGTMVSISPVIPGEGMEAPVELPIPEEHDKSQEGEALEEEAGGVPKPEEAVPAEETEEEVLREAEQESATEALESEAVLPESAEKPEEKGVEEACEEES